MIPKVETCIEAVERGVEGVVILNGKTPHAVLLELFTEHGAGTLITRVRAASCRLDRHPAEVRAIGPGMTTMRRRRYMPVTWPRISPSGFASVWTFTYHLPASELLPPARR